jgi:hypothetical protein
MKTLEHFRFVTQEINPSELTVIINKAHIICFVANKRGRRASENIRFEGPVEVLVDLE